MRWGGGADKRQTALVGSRSLRFIRTQCRFEHGPADHCCCGDQENDQGELAVSAGIAEIAQNPEGDQALTTLSSDCLLYTSDAADE